jgi:4-hydroxybenzoate polyprenyltransferase
MPKIKAILISLRPSNWLKNGFLFAPLIFGGKLFNREYFTKEILAFIAFCLCASAAYLINDVIDFKMDSLHPTKSQRPIIRGILSKTFAIITSILIFILSLLIGLFVHRWLGIILIGYYLINLLYSLYLKQHIIIDVMTIAFDFELRIWAGSVVLGIVPSVWLQMTTFLLALFVAFAKRRQEMFLLGEIASEHRQVLSRYPLPLLDQFISLCAGLSILTYALYTVSPEVQNRIGGGYIIYTLPFVIYGVFRYLYLIWSEKESGNPVEALLSDKPLLASALLWILLILVILYR